MSPFARRVWIEITANSDTIMKISSPFARRVWIEIYLNKMSCSVPMVTLREKGVD